jgi:2-desacetyl-2-hydroxyethyl bacteriochlorophyllide A dehydrogenase
MKYIVCQQPGQLLLKDKKGPDPKADEAVLSIKKIGVCGTDLHAYLGNQAYFTYPRILGHELACEVLEVGDNTQGIGRGDRVIPIPYLSCGTCRACKNGKTNCCVTLKVLGVHVDGGMQEYITAPTSLLIKSNNLSFNEKAIVQPLAIGAHAIRRAQLKKDKFVVVVGCGPIGVGILKQAQINGAKVIMLDTNNARLDYALNVIKADYALNAIEDPIPEIARITNGEMASVVFDATGNKTALEKGIEYMGNGGRYVLVGLSNGELTFTHPAIHAKESTILCSRNATLEDFKHVIDMLPRFPTADFITHEIKFENVVDTFNSLTKSESGVMKAVINLTLAN